MSLYSRILVVFAVTCVVSIPAFSQEDKSTSPKEQVKEQPKSEGLRKIETRSRLQDLDIDIRIDHEALEDNIEAAVENAMKSVEQTLERLEIHIEPIEINL